MSGFYQQHCSYLPAIAGWFVCSAALTAFNKVFYFRSFYVMPVIKPCPPNRFILLGNPSDLTLRISNYTAGCVWRKSRSISVPSLVHQLSLFDTMGVQL
mmetsp:Transcript_33545/g.61664  ORF Transcript_33545/g.61664 Transcript_33545/m.61664 type:complete len:99 (-) Transcript_33545:117-413(-)